MYPTLFFPTLQIERKSELHRGTLSPSTRWRNTVRGSLFLPIHKVGKKTAGWRGSTLFLPVRKVEKHTEGFTLSPHLIFFEKESNPSTLQMERKSVPPPPPTAFFHLTDEEKECPHRTCQLGIHFGWIPGSSALST